MKTLQEKYNAIQEDNFSKSQFKRDAIMECGHLVTHFNSYDDIVNILTNRGIISEAKKEDQVSDYAQTDVKPEDRFAPDVLDTATKYECDQKHGTLDVSEEEYAKCKAAAIKNLDKDLTYYIKKESGQSKEGEVSDQMEKVQEVKVKVSIPGQDEFEAEQGKDYSEEEADKYIKNAKNSGATPMNTTFKKINEESSLEDVLALAQAYAEENYPKLDSEDIGDFIQLHGQEILDGDDLETSFDNFVQHNFPIDEEMDTKVNIKEDVYATLIDHLTQMGLDTTNARFLAGLAKLSVNVGTIPAIMGLVYKNRNNPMIKKGLEKIDKHLTDGDEDIAEENLSTPDAEDLYQNDPEYIAQLKKKEALKEGFRKLIKNVIEG